uniref:RAB37, member RAS oncogene family n=1 Tax=Sinocyclocheilus grahami TaxID=75366 RepID=A0A672S8X6_SINGR
MLLGDSAVGKTCVLVRFKDGAFLGGNFIATVGIDFRVSQQWMELVKGAVSMWDTAGQERFRSVTHAYYRDAQGKYAIFILLQLAQAHPKVFQWGWVQDSVVSDMAAERVITHEEGEKLAKEYGVPFMETSAKTGVNVELAFQAIARELKHRNIQQPHDPKFKIHDYIESQKQKSNCCGGLM